MTSSFERSRLVLGALLILSALALGAGSSTWEAARPDVADPVAPAPLPETDAEAIETPAPAAAPAAPLFDPGGWR